MNAVERMGSVFMSAVIRWEVTTVPVMMVTGCPATTTVWVSQNYRELDKTQMKHGAKSENKKLQARVCSHNKLLTHLVNTNSQFMNSRFWLVSAVTQPKLYNISYYKYNIFFIYNIEKKMHSPLSLTD